MSELRALYFRIGKRLCRFYGCPYLEWDGYYTDEYACTLYGKVLRRYKPGEMRFSLYRCAECLENPPGQPPTREEE
jgi:hypothetical protein